MGSIDFRSVFNRFTIDEGEDDGDDGDDAIGFPACPTHVQGVPKMTICLPRGPVCTTHSLEQN